jgi:cell wall-associated NlpC family hydrolase
VGEGVDVNFDNVKTGDLAFFEKDGKITHVGIIISNGKIIHASGKVRIDDFTAEGIRIGETGELTHKLSCIKRV